jgi:hypothetical protein
MKKLMLAVAVVVAVGAAWACSRKAPQSEVRSEESVVAVDGPVREVTFEPDVIVAYHPESDGE